MNKASKNFGSNQLSAFHYSEQNWDGRKTFEDRFQLISPELDLCDFDKDPEW